MKLHCIHSAYQDSEYFVLNSAQILSTRGIVLFSSLIFDGNLEMFGQFLYFRLMNVETLENLIRI